MSDRASIDERMQRLESIVACLLLERHGLGCSGEVPDLRRLRERALFGANAILRDLRAPMETRRTWT